ncbi:MAG: GNAT family N-acetyltransferase [Chitinophagaceae bacterium]|nr:MAG: GNAT family N-acetyltransferase [Chitinophagaceae bacterium]
MSIPNTTEALLIRGAHLNDLSAIMLLYEQAIAFQKKNNYIGWEKIDEAFIRADLEQGLLYKISSDNRLVAAFCTCYSDPLIWREMERGDAFYLHRLVIDPVLRGGRMFERVLQWALEHARQKGLSNIRMDTWADNEKLIRYYEGYGFRFVEAYQTPDDPALPVQHRKLNVALLERSISL